MTVKKGDLRQIRSARADPSLRCHSPSRETGDTWQPVPASCTHLGSAGEGGGTGPASLPLQRAAKPQLGSEHIVGTTQARACKRIHPRTLQEAWRTGAHPDHVWRLASGGQQPLPLQVAFQICAQKQGTPPSRPSEKHHLHPSLSLEAAATFFASQSPPDSEGQETFQEGPRECGDVGQEGHPETQWKVRPEA